MKTSIESKSNEYEHHTEELILARQMMEDEENAFDQIATNTEQENREAEEEGVKEAENFVYFNPSSFVDFFDFCFTALQHILGHFERGQLP